MQSSLIGKIEKARRYAQERDRVRIRELTLDFRGDHSNYTLSYSSGSWRCQCSFFLSHGTCSHTMALERVLGDLLTHAVATPA
ncbi:MAG: hypothetical protein HYY01_15070 [Chloroflexi bacterium]|nr:hypothetical protein [Chloroflexota bacterium]